MLPNTYSNWSVKYPRPHRPASGWLGDAPTFSFHGKGRRVDIVNGPPGNKPSWTADPGPGAYEQPVANGPQIDSRKHSSQSSRVGTASRDVRFKQYVSKDAEKDLYGKFSPAPNLYNPNIRPVSAVGLGRKIALTEIINCLPPPQSSRVKTPQSFGFGSGDRFSQLKSGNGQRLKVWTPGPGTYVT